MKAKLIVARVMLLIALLFRRRRPSYTAADVFRWPVACWLGEHWPASTEETALRAPLEEHMVKFQGTLDARHRRLRYRLRRWLRVRRTRRRPTEPSA